MQTDKDVFVISAPSASGKTTINRRLVDEVEDLTFSISYTTRPQRDGEEDGVHYWFIKEKNFKEAIKNNEMLEWAEVHKYLYGTSINEIKKILSQNKKPLLEIDVQGWKQIKKRIPSATSIYILPPSIEALWSRLDERGTDNHEVKLLRMRTTRQELDLATEYQYFVINDDLERAFTEMKEFVTLKKPLKISKNEGLVHCKKLIEQYDQLPFLK